MARPVVLELQEDDEKKSKKQEIQYLIRYSEDKVLTMIIIHLKAFGLTIVPMAYVSIFIS